MTGDLTLLLAIAAGLILCHGLVLHHADTMHLDRDDLANHQIVMANARRKISRPSVIIRIMTIGLPANGRSATRSMPMPMPIMLTMASGTASHIDRPNEVEKNSTM